MRFLRPLLRSSSLLEQNPWKFISNFDKHESVVFDKQKFQVNIDVKQYAPEELKVKVDNNCIVVEGKHEEKEDKYGFVSRQFLRRYYVPKGHDIGKIESQISNDGILSVTAPKIETEEKEKERNIPIKPTGEPFKK